MVKNNKLEYVFIKDQGYNANILATMELYINIVNLRCFYVITANNNINLTLNIGEAEEYPEKLQVFVIKNSRGSNTTESLLEYTIKGNKIKVQQLRTQFIHEIELKPIEETKNNQIW